MMRCLLACAAALVFSTASALASDCNLAAPDAASAGADCSRAWMDQNLHLNDIVTVGTHNSYKEAIPDKIMALIRMGARKDALSLDYAHIPLADQLSDGARAIEIDVAYDPKGGLYAHPAGAAMTGVPLPDGYDTIMSKPGFKVLHVQDIDYRSVCMTLVTCLQELKAWSAAHPDHIPILVTMNAKDDEIPFPGSVTPLKFDTSAFDALDAEILSVFSPAEIVTPDQVQGSYPTLRDAVLQHGWPTLGETRGKFIFALDEDGPKLKAYQGGRKSLEGRVMFVNAPEDSPAAAYLTLNEALTDTAHITHDVALGYLVRTRADADTVEARVDDTTRRDKALASGAQFVSTDYMEPDTRFGPYQVRMPEGFVAACNPQRHPERCAGLPVESAP
ncbi:MAG: phosphatidylinositol-specific phospholipase C1-like protein [Rhizomicrobium sp.]